MNAHRKLGRYVGIETERMRYQESPLAPTRVTYSKRSFEFQKFPIDVPIDRDIEQSAVYCIITIVNTLRQYCYSP